MPFHAGDYQVEAVKSANGRLTRGTSLRGARVHIFELPELGAIARTAENGDAVLPCRRLRAGTKTDFGDACRIARLEGGCGRLAGTILMGMFGRPDGGLGRLRGYIIAHMNARVSLIR